MSKTRFVLSIAVVALLVATPAMGQLLNYPVTALPAGDADGATSIGAGWGRGLNENSLKLNAFGAGVTRAMETVSFAVAGAYVIDAGGPDASELGLRGSVAYNVPMDGSVAVGIQGGIEWMSPDAGTALNFPLGVSISGATEAGSLILTPWVMPRVQFTRFSPTTGDSSTETDFGASGGISGVTEGGWGLGLSVDWVSVDDGSGTNSVSQLLFGAAVFYQLP